MEWSNEAVLEFLELLQTEPSIWNPKNRDHKNRNLVNDAWVRIKNSFSIPFTVEELKKKRNSLLTQYRDNLKKIKDTTKTGSGADEIFKPTWFAFDVMHKYMGSVYDYRTTLSTEERSDSSIERPQSRESESSNFTDSNTLRYESRVSNNRSQTPESQSDSYVTPKKRRGMQDVLVAKKQMDEAFAIIKERSNRNTKEINECDLYGQLLAEKLKPLREDHRMILMNEIDNLVFKYIMEIRKETSTQIIQTSVPVSRQSIYVPRSSQSEQYSVSPQECVLPGPSTRQYPAASKVSRPDPEPRLESIKKYETLSTLTPFQTDIQVQAEVHQIPGRPIDAQIMSQHSNYITYTGIACDYDDNIASFTLPQKPEVPRDRKINVISETIIRPKNSHNIIQEAYKDYVEPNTSDDDEY